MRLALVVVLPALVGILYVVMIREGPADPRLLEMATRHAEQQAIQNDRLAELQHQWQVERRELYEQRDQLESERKQLAIERQREPVIAESILQVGSLALALLPLSFAIVLLGRSQERDSSDAISETLVSDLLSRQPVLVGRESTRHLPDHLSPSSSKESPSS